MKTFGLVTFGSGTFGDGLAPIALTTGDQNLDVVGVKAASDDIAIVGGGDVIVAGPTFGVISGGGHLHATGTKSQTSSVTADGGTYYGDIAYGEGVFGAGSAPHASSGGNLHASGAKGGATDTIVDAPTITTDGDITLASHKQGQDDVDITGGGRMVFTEAHNVVISGGDTSTVVGLKHGRRKLDLLLRGGGETWQVGNRQSHPEFPLVWSTGGELTATVLANRILADGVVTTGEVAALPTAAISRTADVVLSGGGNPHFSARNEGHADLHGGGDITIVGGQANKSDIAITGGGDPVVVGQKIAASDTAISSGGDIALESHKNGQSAVVVTTGGDLVGDGFKHGTGVDLESSGGELSSVGLKGEYPQAELHGGGINEVIGAKGAAGDASDTGGGDTTAIASAGHYDVIAISTGGDLVAAGYKGGTGTWLITGGGDATVVIAKGGAGQLTITGGGELVFVGERGAAVRWILSGGGSIYGPWPIVLRPAVLKREHEGHVRTLNRDVLQLTRRDPVLTSTRGNHTRHLDDE